MVNHDNIITKEKFKFTNTHFFILGLLLVVIGSVSYYYYGYKQSDLIMYTFIGCLFIGWTTMQVNLFANLLPNKPKSFKEPGAIKQRLISILIAISVIAIMFGNGYVIYKLEMARENAIMANQPTAMTTVLVTYITITRSNRTSATYYHAHLRYIANGKTFFCQRPDNSGYLVTGKTYPLKYSVEYPEMIIIYK